ncbi:MAG TPA: hypothetical protein VN960_05575 [Gaiellaceae bacterium]|nr:hypothetical protein [Gaiellaceae bacterium]
MSRRDYIATAAILRDADLTAEQREELARRFVTMFADNPRFSPSRFLAAALPEDSTH